MKTRLIALNVLLAAGIVAAAWQLKVYWRTAAADRAANLNVKIRPVTAPPAAPAARPETPAPAQYAQVAEKNLFAGDRNPTVVIEPEKVEAPKPMPPLPVVYGVMGLPSGVKAIMAERAGQSSRAIRTGDTIGDFKVLALDTQNVKFEWNGKEVDRRIADLVDRSTPQQSAGNSNPAPPPPVNQPAAPTRPVEANLNVALGVTLTENTRACRPGENSPAGTVVDGYKKSITASPFGNVCRWTK